MQAKKRYAYLLLVFVVAFILRWMLFSAGVGHRRRFAGDYPVKKDNLVTNAYWPNSAKVEFAKRADVVEKKVNKVLRGRNLKNRCTMNTCFDHSRCVEWPLRVYIHPRPNGSDDSVANSEGYERILQSIRESKFYTDDPSKACLFVLPWDTLSRDRLSPSYVSKMQSKLHTLPKHLWRNGMNHLIFNLYSGTWPNYELDDLGFDPGKAILAKASFSTYNYRPGFDISLALFHDVLPLRGPLKKIESVPSVGGYEQLSSRYMLVFKGKRYVFGIGSETRNSLYHLHNGRDVIMLTTCKHGKEWKKNQDERCPIDNEMYERWNYEDLMANSSFCLVPRGRRLGSFRFLESLEKGCIPVVVSNNWVLPFSEVINWTRAAFQIDERTLFQIPTLLRFIPSSLIRRMKYQAKHLYRLYFASVDKIVDTVFQIISDRLWPNDKRSDFVWNIGLAGARYHLSRFSSNIEDYPFYKQPVQQCRMTAIVTCYATPCDNLPALVGTLQAVKFIHKVFILHEKGKKLPSLPTLLAPTSIVVMEEKFLLHFVQAQFTSLIAIFDGKLIPKAVEIEYAVEMWRWLPHKLVGFDSLNASSNQKGFALLKSAEDACAFLTGSALLFHRYYVQLVLDPPLKRLKRLLVERVRCWDVALNFIVAEATGMAPLCLKGKSTEKGLTRSPDSSSKQHCLNSIVVDGYCPLRKGTAFHPVTVW